MHLEFFELPDHILRSQTFPVRMAGATRAYLLCMPCVTEAVCVFVHDPDHADEWEEHRCLCDYTFDPKAGVGTKTPLFDGDEEAYVWSLRLLASDAAARRRLMRLCDDMKNHRYTLEPAPDGGSWLVLAADGGKIGELHLTAAYERDDIGRAHHALYATIWLPVPPRRNWHPCASMRIWARDPWATEPLEAHMPQPWPDPDRDEDGIDHLERARVVLADLWLSGEVKGLWRRVME